MIFQVFDFRPARTDAVRNGGRKGGEVSNITFIYLHTCEHNGVPFKTRTCSTDVVVPVSEIPNPRSNTILQHAPAAPSVGSRFAILRVVSVTGWLGTTAFPFFLDFFRASLRFLDWYSRFSSRVSNTLQVSDTKFRHSSPSMVVQLSNMVSVSSVCSLNFARECQWAKTKRRLRTRPSWSPGSKPSKAGIAH